MRKLLQRVAFVLIFGAACSSSEIGLDVAIPRDLAEETAWIEIGAFKDGSCRALAPILQGGVPDGASARIAFPPNEPPTFGDLKTGDYAFAAVARKEDCSVLAIACTEANVGDVGRITLALEPLDEPSGACSEGSSCQAARCVPANDNANVSVGAGCSLELLGAGPLPSPLGGEGTIVGAPSIIPNGDGFLVIYRETNPNGSTARLAMVPIDSAGGAIKVSGPQLPNRCASSDEKDGIGIVRSGDQLFIGMAKAPCGDSPALELVRLRPPTSEAAEQPQYFAPLPIADRATLGNGHSASNRTGGSALVAYASGGVARIAQMDPAKGMVTSNGTFGGPQATNAWLAATDTTLALLSAGIGAPPKTEEVDAGDPDAATPEPEPTGDPVPTLNLLMVPSNVNVDELNAAALLPRRPIPIPANWGSLAMRGSRVIVMHDSETPSRPAAYRIYDQMRETATDTNGISIRDAEKAIAGDVAIEGDRLFFAVASPGGLSLVAYESATTTPRLLTTRNFLDEPRIPRVTTIREDGAVALAATPKRVAVVWTTTSSMQRNDSTGAYAVFACTP